MRERIETHRAERPSDWRTLEAPLHVGERLASNQVREPIVVMDCMTLLVSNVLLSCGENAPFEEVKQKVGAEIDALLEAHSKIGGRWFIVSNEVGLGLVPPYALGRVYRDLLGWANQSLARSADRVIFMVAGIPTVIK
jgi:adenosylcobinamide kinase/adenosylcobinamide-phosphate guanylyltransferase